MQFAVNKFNAFEQSKLKTIREMNKILSKQSTSIESQQTLPTQQNQVSLPAEQLQKSFNFMYLYRSLSSQAVYMKLARMPHLVAQVFASALHS